MLIALASVKGSPGVTSAALALAAVWPNPVVLVEADPSGGDLTYRCRLSPGTVIESRSGLVGLAAAVRSHAGHGSRDVAGMGAALRAASVELACGVRAVTGVTSAAQSRGLAGVWPAINSACAGAGLDVITDLGRVGPDHPAAPLVSTADHLLVVASATLASVMHLHEAIPDLVASRLGRTPGMRCSPVLVGPDAHATRDGADLDSLLSRHGLALEPTLAVPFDQRALHRLEDGESPSGRLGRTLLLRATRSIALSLSQGTDLGSQQIVAPRPYAPPPTPRPAVAASQAAEVSS